MPRSAAASFNKVVKTCPHCKNKNPKELIQGPKRTDWIWFWGLAIFTVGIGLIAVPLWYKPFLEAYCPECKETFPPN